MTRETKISEITKEAENISTETYFDTQIVKFKKNDMFYYIAFKGRSTRPSYYYFLSEPNREESLNITKARIKSNHEKKVKYLENKKIESDLISVGTILYSSWGYEQTNINFYIVLNRKNTVVTIQEIGKHKEFEGRDYGTCTPNINNKIGEPFQKRITKHASIKINEVEDASKYDGSKIHWSSWY
ncbi:hypothetical protein NZD88_20845 [Chryseobacterium antibioticum]|uniref:Uncharacterized protein n=1 Tax=Chryseobacterium pyrolae TaxID=2987481 RepID=A0ABT2IN13_9FLAO|nr:hypothetical protein [Chryseobacterium pyrolae]MCT2410011.1 hypothetical protein [Chryseobacterium pyrolae]